MDNFRWAIISTTMRNVSRNTEEWYETMINLRYVGGAYTVSPFGSVKSNTIDGWIFAASFFVFFRFNLMYGADYKSGPCSYIIIKLVTLEANYPSRLYSDLATLSNEFLWFSIYAKVEIRTCNQLKSGSIKTMILL